MPDRWSHPFNEKSLQRCGQRRTCANLIVCYLTFSSLDIYEYKTQNCTKNSTFFMVSWSHSFAELKFVKKMCVFFSYRVEADTYLQLSKSLVFSYFTNVAWLCNYRTSNRSDVFLFHLPWKSFVQSAQALLWHVRRSKIDSKSIIGSHITWLILTMPECMRYAPAILVHSK